MSDQKLVTRVSADIAKICGKKAVVMTKMNPSGNVDIIIESDCENIKSLAENLKGISIKDSCMIFEENPVFILAGKNNVTPTCIVPSAIVNAVWIEAGLIARSLALNAKELKILFEEV
ncbi:MAG: hypothetical protein H3Z53_12630 [archaeon]|nr:hypothetical protein [archaeon]MCP8316538.1 hypothetical protein [archaeon]